MHCHPLLLFILLFILLPLSSPLSQSVFSRRCLLAVPALLVPFSSVATTAIGSAERSCRERGDCWERGDWDGALGYNWGGRDRCDAGDPKCGSGGQAVKVELPPAPVSTERTTHRVVLSGVAGGGDRRFRFQLPLVLYGDAHPVLVSQLLESVQGGFRGQDRAASAPVRLSGGSGAVTNISPGGTFSVGVPSQRLAFLRENGLRKDPSFVPVARPPSQPSSPRGPESVAPGSVLMDARGLGYLISGEVDTAFAALFEVAGPRAEGGGGTMCVGRVDDMQVYARLSSTAVNKKIWGVIGEVRGGPPLLPVRIDSVEVAAIP
jgi:hypothetical protein